MAKNYRSKTSMGSRNTMSAIMIGAVAVVLILAIIAITGVIKDSAARSRREALQAKLDSFSATIGERADDLGMTFEDFLSYYGLEESGLNAGDEEQKAYESMTLANFAKFNTGAEITEDEFNEFKAASELGDDVTTDTTDMEVKQQYIAYQQQKQQEAQAAQQAAQSAEAGVSAEIPEDVSAEAPDGGELETDGAAETDDAE